jgi:regulator of RNase E activity RraB
MKNLILLTCLCITSFIATADDLKKEKKILIETIKANYDSWQIKKSPPESNGLFDSAISENLADVVSQENNPSQIKNGTHIFSDFNFKICETQAVVKFQVDFQMISAFMEKKDGKWQLVCAAVIPPDL